MAVSAEESGSGDAQWLSAEVAEVEDGEWTALCRLEEFSSPADPPAEEMPPRLQEPSEEVPETTIPTAVPEEAEGCTKSTQSVWLSPLQWLAQGFMEKGASGIRPSESESSAAHQPDSDGTSEESTVRCPSSPPLPRFKLKAGTDPSCSQDGKGVYRKSFLSRRDFDAPDSETSQSSRSVPQHWQQQVQQLMSLEQSFKKLQKPRSERERKARNPGPRVAPVRTPELPTARRLGSFSAPEAIAEPVQGGFFRGYGCGHSSPEAPRRLEQPQQTQQQLQTMLCHELSELVKVQQAWYSMLSSACRHPQEQPRPEMQQSFYDHRWTDPRGSFSQSCPQVQYTGAVPRAPSLSFSQMVPTLNPWTHDAGKLLAALRQMGAVYITDDGLGCLPRQSFGRWRDLWYEALFYPAAYRRKQATRAWQLRFSQGEDLLRTLKGTEKSHTPDVRYNFGLGVESLHRCNWGDLQWVCDELCNSFAVISRLIFHELTSAVPLADEPPKTLGSLLYQGVEQFAGSRMRHSIYPCNGSCTEHTDYGVVTFQQSTAAGLQAQLPNGQWLPLQPPDTGGLLFAGDMLERMTNGQVRALVHRVCLDPSAASVSEPSAVRQSHILFLQPDRNTLVRPLRPFCTGNDMPPVRYGDWHKSKTSLAFDR
ncbi:unnamed protein product [Symbiodinium sp. CCMP2592]|nr:unnamed protein product [Symbiodinium sp. CCMP2592]